MSHEWDQKAGEQALADWVGVVKVGRRHYAASLIWNNADDPKMLLADAKEAAQRVGSELFAIRKRTEGPGQYALGDLFLGHKAGLPSLAATLAATTSSALYGIWHLGEDIWWLVGIRADGTIAYDKGLANLDAAQSEFYEGLGTEAWSEIICPAEWEVTNSVADRDLRARLKRSPVRLRSLNPNIARPVIFLVILALAAGGGWQLLKKLTAPPPPPPMPVFHKKPRAVPQVLIPPMPWVGKPLPYQVLQVCMVGLLDHATDANSLAGWERTGPGVCDGTSVTYTIKRNFGTSNWLKPLAAQLADAPTVQTTSPDSATLSWPLPTLNLYDSTSPGTVLDESQKNLQAQFNEYFIPIQFSPISEQPYWRTLSYTVNNTVSPDVFIPLIGLIPGSVIDLINYDADDETWQIKGSLYQAKDPNENEASGAIASTPSKPPAN